MNNVKLVDALIARNYHITVAESCTGGMLASRIIDVPNASKVFDESFVTYANEAKIHYLGVSELTIKQYGVVSEEVVKEMALGLLSHTKADCSIGISGIAGPDGGSEKKPVGMVCFGFAIKGKVITNTIIFPNTGRNSIRKKAVSYAIKQMLSFLGEYHD